jgi:hypothetical protein
MSVTNEKAFFQILDRKLKADKVLSVLRNELVHHAQVYHLTITAPARKCKKPEQSKQIIESMFAGNRMTAVKDVVEAIQKCGIDLSPDNFEDFCEALDEIAGKPPTTLPPIPHVSSPRPRKEPEGIAFYTKMLNGLRSIVRT